MTSLQILANLAAYACFALGGLLVWPSRRNVIALLGVPFFVIAYLIPLLAVDYADVASPAAIADLSWMNLFGGVAMVAGLLAGARLRMPGFRRLVPAFMRTGAGAAASMRRTYGMILGGCVVMSLCFAWMGFLPIFADDPFLAKFFRGEYKERYDQVAIAYRLSQTMLSAALPLAMALYVDSRDRRLLMPIVWAVVLFAVSLNRGTVVAGAVMLCAAWASRKTLRMAIFLLLMTLVYGLGSSIYVVLGIVVSDDFNLWAEIARGAPDVKDHLTFLQAFNPAKDLTYGLTFVGGIVPGNFRFNPSVYTLGIANGTFDVSEIASGGFRLPPSLAGFTAFSWYGGVLVTVLTGVLTGAYTARLRRLPRVNLSQQVASLLWFQIVAGFWIGFYAMSYQGLIAVALLVYMVPDLQALASISRPFPCWRRRGRTLSAAPMTSALPHRE